MEDKSIKNEIHWPKILWFIHVHVFGICGFYYIFIDAHWLTTIFVTILVVVANLGITVGAHRLWCHRTFEATKLLRLFLIIAHTLAGVGPVHEWVLKHRMHHKFYGTEKDLFNHEKGFLYSHVLSNCVSHDIIIEKYGKEIDMRDLDNDGFVWFQRKFYWPLFLIVGILLPVNCPTEYWDESIINCIFIMGFMRFAITLNMSWLVNSSKIIWGLKPGDKLMPFIETFSLFYKLFFKMPKSHGTVMIDGDGLHTIYPPDDNSIFIINKSYWLNYHYLYPWDYKSGEYGTYDKGWTTIIIKMLHEIGQIKLLQTVSPESIREALYKIATDKKANLNNVIDDVRNTAQVDAKKVQLYCSN